MFSVSVRASGTHDGMFFSPASNEPVLYKAHTLGHIGIYESITAEAFTNAHARSLIKSLMHFSHTLPFDTRLAKHFLTLVGLLRLAL